MTGAAQASSRNNICRRPRRVCAVIAEESICEAGINNSLSLTLYLRLQQALADISQAH